MVVGLVGLDSTGASTIAVGATAAGLQVAMVDTSGNGIINALGQSVTAVTSGYSTVLFTLTGTWSATMYIEGFDGTQWFTTQGVLEPVGILLTNVIDNQTISINCGGMQKVRLRSTAFTSGTVNISWNAGSGVNSVWAYNYNPSTFNATVVQPTGSNLHTVLDSGTLTAIGSITNNVNTVEVPPTGILHGRVTVNSPGTRVQFGTNTVKSIVVKAFASNTGLIFVGGSAVVSTDGFQLSAGDTVSLDIVQTSTVWIDSEVSGEGVTWLAVS